MPGCGPLIKKEKNIPMKNFINYLALLTISGATLLSCVKTARDIQIPYPDDITFEDQSLDRFSFSVPDAPFKSGNAKSGIVTMNVKKNQDGTYSGFAVSNKNWRSYPWNLSSFAPTGLSQKDIDASIDSTIFSVYTTRPNHTGTFLVGCVNEDDANITLASPAVVEHILVANTTYNYLLESYGSVYSGSLDPVTQQYLPDGKPVQNIQNPNTSTEMYGQFRLPGPGGSNLIRMAGEEIRSKTAAGKAAADAARSDGKTADQVAADSTKAASSISTGYVKLTIDGFKGSTATGAVDYWLAVRPKVDSENPGLDYIAPDWFKVDLTSLGSVDKLVFHLSSSYTDGTGKMRYPGYFCLDGIRLKNK